MIDYCRGMDTGVLPVWLLPGYIDFSQLLQGCGHWCIKLYDWLLQGRGHWFIKLYDWLFQVVDTRMLTV